MKWNFINLPDISLAETTEWTPGIRRADDSSIDAILAQALVDRTKPAFNSLQYLGISST